MNKAALYIEGLGCENVQKTSTRYGIGDSVDMRGVGEICNCTLGDSDEHNTFTAHGN